MASASGRGARTPRPSCRQNADMADAIEEAIRANAGLIAAKISQWRCGRDEAAE